MFWDTIAGEPVTLVHCWAPWNGNDVVTDEALAPLRERFAGEVAFYSLNIEDRGLWELIDRLRVMTVPTLLYFVKGGLAEVRAGVRSAPQVSEDLLRLIGEAQTIGPGPLTRMRLWWKEVRSLGYRTDLGFFHHAGQFGVRSDHLIVRSPACPDYYWGNFLLFETAPGPDDFHRWSGLFHEAFRDQPGVRHVAFGWDSPDGERGEIESFLAAGFHVEESIVLTAEQVQPPPRPNRDVTIRRLVFTSDWQASVQNRLLHASAGAESEAYRRFERGQMEQNRMVMQAAGAWFGAYLGGQLVADLGIYGVEGLVRFRSVVTHPHFRGLGIGGTLVHAAALHALETWNSERVVIVTEEGSQAERLYRSIGFGPAERQIGVWRAPHADVGETVEE